MVTAWSFSFLRALCLLPSQCKRWEIPQTQIGCWAAITNDKWSACFRELVASQGSRRQLRGV